MAGFGRLLKTRTRRMGKVSGGAVKEVKQLGDVQVPAPKAKPNQKAITNPQGEASTNQSGFAERGDMTAADIIKR